MHVHRDGQPRFHLGFKNIFVLTIATKCVNVLVRVALRLRKLNTGIGNFLYTFQYN